MAADRSAQQERKPADVVLSGGGVKFIGLVGAIVALMDAGYSFQRVSGVSAGSVVASILAAASKGDQLTSEEVKELALSVPLREWRDAGPVPYLGASWGLLRDTSMYHGEVAYDWIRSELKNLGVTTFGDLALDEDSLIERGALSSPIITYQVLVAIPVMARRSASRESAVTSAPRRTSGSRLSQRQR